MQSAILKSLLDWNPWLTGPFPKELAGITRPDYELQKLLSLPEIKILEGARRVGKSTLLYQLIEHLHTNSEQVIYLNFDDETLSQHTLDDIYHTILSKYSIDYLFLDEIQHCTEWVHLIRKLYDTKQLKQIWISGSNSSLLKHELKTLLSGRNITLKIHTLSFKEYLNFKGINDVSALSSKQQSAVIAHFDTYLNYGAFPAIALRDFYHKELLLNYFEDILFKDIVTRYDANPTKIKELGLYLASNSSKQFSQRKIAAALNLHPKTVSDYLSYFYDVFLFSGLCKFDFSLQKQFTNEKKIYSLDSGLAAANAFKFSNDQGRMLENLVFNQLNRQHSEIFFHKNKKECDFIIKTDLKITQAIQVCYSLDDEQTKKREIDGLIEACHTYKLRQGIILTIDDEDEIKVTYEATTYTISIIPTWKWLLYSSQS